MEFLVEFEFHVPDGAPASEVSDRETAEASAAAKLADEGHLVRVWKRAVAAGGTKVVASTAPTAKPSSMVCSAHYLSTSGCTSPSCRSKPIPTTRQHENQR